MNDKKCVLRMGEEENGRITTGRWSDWAMNGEFGEWENDGFASLREGERVNG